MQLQILNDTLAKVGLPCPNALLTRTIGADSCRFAKTDYPTTEERQAIAVKLDIPVRRVQVWFQNVRVPHQSLSGERAPV